MWRASVLITHHPSVTATITELARGRFHQFVDKERVAVSYFNAGIPLAIDATPVETNLSGYLNQKILELKRKINV